MHPLSPYSEWPPSVSQWGMGESQFGRLEEKPIALCLLCAIPRYIRVVNRPIVLLQNSKKPNKSEGAGQICGRILVQKAEKGPKKGRTFEKFVFLLLVSLIQEVYASTIKKENKKVLLHNGPAELQRLYHKTDLVGLYFIRKPILFRNDKNFRFFYKFHVVS
jgi:hypothetical protein